MRIEALERAVAALRALTGPRDHYDAAIIPAIAGAVGSRRFTCRELVAHSRVDPALAAALESADITTPRGCGKVLRRLERHPLSGYVLVRVGQDRDGIIWRVQVSRV